MSKTKYRKPRGCFPEGREGQKQYEAQFDTELERVAYEDDWMDKAMDAQHYRREANLDIIDDMGVREWIREWIR